MHDSEPLCAALLSKIEEQIERADRLIAAVSEDRLGWAVSKLLGHPLECLAGICAVLWSAAPERLATSPNCEACR